MRPSYFINFMMGIYIFIFFAYLFGPLIIMSITAFNSAEFPSITPWECFSFRWFNEGKIAYDGQHLAGLLSDWRLHDGICLLYTSPSPRDGLLSRMPSSA